MMNYTTPINASAHSYLSPSAAHRWMNCNASPYMELMYGKEEEQSEYAQEGTLAHAAMETCLSALRAGETVGNAIDKISSDDKELKHCAIVYVNAVRDTYFEEPEYFGIEERIRLTSVFTVPNQYGTTDCVIISANHLHIFDYKHGIGIPVSPENNPQLSIYALGYLLKPENANITKITLHVVQPRAIGGELHKQWTTDRPTLLSKLEDIRVNAVNAQTIVESQVPTDDDYHPSMETCRWCKAKGACKAFADIPTKALGLPRKLPSPMDATPEQLGKVLQFKTLVQDWFKECEDEAFRRLQIGSPVTGYKLVYGNQGIRRWKDKREAEELLVKSMRIPHEYAYKMEIISPTKADDLAHKIKGKDGKPIIGERQWTRIEPLIMRNPPKPTLVEESDPREAIPLDLSNEMDYIEVKKE